MKLIEDDVQHFSNNNELKKIKASTNIINDLEDLDYYNRFSRTDFINVYDYITGFKEYVFFTKPDLQILKNKDELFPHFKNNIFFNEAFDTYKRLLYQLQNSISSRPYMNILSYAKKSNLELPDISSGEVDNPENIYGDSISYRWSSSSSDNNFDFSIEFRDGMYLELYMLFKIWDMYIRSKQSGSVVIPDYYVINKILHDQISVFRILVSDDHETIIHYSKYTGVYPKSISRSTFNDLSEGLSVNIEFKSTFYEDMTPEILSDINIIYNNHKSIGEINNIPMYNVDLGCVDTKWVNLPVIFKEKSYRSPSGYVYKLKWR